jgi:WD repeat-containing protein 48
VICRDNGGDAGSEGINKIVAADDSFVWTATASSSIKCWRDVEPRSKRAKRERAPRSSMTSGVLFETAQAAGSEDTSPLLGRTCSSPTTAAPRRGDTWRRELFPPPDSTPSPREQRDGNERERHTVSFADESPVGENQSVSVSATRTSPPAGRAATSPCQRPPSLKPTPHSSHRHTRSDSPSLTSPQTFASSLQQHSPSLPVTPPSLCGIPYDSLIPLDLPDDPYAPAFFHGGHDDAATLYSTASLVSVPNAFKLGHPSHSAAARRQRSVSHDFSSIAHTTPSSLRRFSEQAEHEPDADSQAAQLALQEYGMRESVQDAIPLRSTPVAVVRGRNGLIRSEMLNDRRHVLTIDTAGEVAVWDIVLCKFVGAFYFDDIALSLRYDPGGGGGSNEDGGRRAFPSKEALELVKERIEGEGTILPWCTIETRTGSLNVHVQESTYYDAEVYADESGLRGTSADSKDDARISLGRVVLRSLFDGFVKAEVGSRPDPTTPLAASGQKPSFINLPGQPQAAGIITRPAHRQLTGSSITLATPASTPALPPVTDDRLDPARSFSLQSQSTGESAPTTDDGRRSSSDYFSLPKTPTNGRAPAKAPSTTSTSPDGTVETLHSPTKLAPDQEEGAAAVETANADLLTPHATASDARRGDETPTVANRTDESAASQAEQQHRRYLDELFSHPLRPPMMPDMPIVSLPSNVSIAVIQEAADYSTWEPIYQGTVFSTAQDVGDLELASPPWLLEFLLWNAAPAKEQRKIAFSLLPWQDAERAGVPELPDAGYVVAFFVNCGPETALTTLQERPTGRQSDAADPKNRVVRGREARGATTATAFHRVEWWRWTEWDSIDDDIARALAFFVASRSAFVQDARRGSGDCVQLCGCPAAGDVGERAAICRKDGWRYAAVLQTQVCGAILDDFM